MQFVRLERFVDCTKFTICLLVLAAVIPVNTNADEFVELAELVKAHENGMKRCCSYSYKIVELKGGVSFFYGGKDRCLSEHRAGNRVSVVCSTPEYLFRLSQKDAGKSFFVDEIEFRDNVASSAALTASLAESNFLLLSPFYYLDLRIANFLSQKSVTVEEVSRGTGTNGEREVTVKWKWNDAESGIWVGRFVLLPDRFWCVRKIERTRDFSIGFMGIENEFDSKSIESPLFVKRTVSKNLVGKDAEVVESSELVVLSDVPENAARFKLSFYGLSDEVGKPGYSVGFYLAGFAFIAFLIVVMSFLRAKNKPKEVFR